MNSATYKRPFKPVSSFASADGKNNLAGAGSPAGGLGYHQAAHTDGGSGGPMSTTSNVLNLGGDQQQARLQESSIISNLANSNSSSNGQKTPIATLSQGNQVQALVGTCLQCGAQQQQLGQVNFQNQPKQPDNQQPGGQQVQLLRASNSGAAPPRANPAALEARTATAKVLQNPRPGSRDSQLALKRFTDNNGDDEISFVTKQSSSTTRRRAENQPCLLRKRAGSGSISSLANDTSPESNRCERYLVEERKGRQFSEECENKCHYTAPGAERDDCELDADDDDADDGDDDDLGQQHRLRHKHQGASCCLGDAGTQADQQTHWSQSIYSIDYCSDCCPSYCHCSCQACASSQSNEETNGPLEGTPCMQMNGATCRGGPSTALSDESSPLAHDSLIISKARLDGANAYNAGPSKSSSSSIRRRKSEQELPLEGAGKFANHGDAIYFLRAGGNKASKDERRNKELDLAKLGSGAANSSACDFHQAKRSQTMEMKTLTSFSNGANEFNAANHLLQQVKPEPLAVKKTIDSAELAGFGSDPAASMQGAQAKQHNQQRQASNQQQQQSSIVFAALQAANSAFGACTIQPAACAANSIQQMKNYNNIQLASNQDKSSEKGALLVRAEAEATWSRQQQLGTSRRQPDNSADVQGRPEAETPFGHIQASLNMIKSNSERLESGPADQADRSAPSAAKQSRSGSQGNRKQTRRRQRQSQNQDQRQSRRHGGGCFDYHDDYEYNYGLVESDSDAGYLNDEEDETERLGAKSNDSSLLSEANVDFQADLNVEQKDCDDEDEFGEDDDYDGADDDDDFEHDGRLALNRSSTQARRKRRATTRRRQKSSLAGSAEGAGAPDVERRINSVALIAATLSAGGAIVDCSGKVTEQDQAPS